MPGFSFTTIEPNQLGRVTKWDVPINDWLGLKAGAGYSDTLGNAISRATEDYIWDDGNLVRPDVLNRTYGIDGALKFDKPLSIQRARLMHERKRKELERQAYFESASHSWFSGKAAAGFGAALVGGLSHPADLGLSFLPFIGSEKAATSVARLGGSAWRQGLARGVIAEERLAGVVPFHRLSAAVIDGVVNQAVMEIPIAIQKHRDQANYGLTDSAFNILAGGAFAGAMKGLGLALERAGKLWREADPRIREAAIQDTVRSMMTGEPPKAHWAFGLDEATIRAKVEEKVGAENPFAPTTTKGLQEPTQLTGDDLADVRLDEPGVTRATEPDSIVIQLRDLQSRPIGEVVIKPTGDDAVDAKAVADRIEVEAGKDSRVSIRESAGTLTNEKGLAVSRYVNTFNGPAWTSIEQLIAARRGIDMASIEAERQKSAEDFLTKAKAEHEAKVKGIIDAETQKAIAEIRQQHPSPPKEQTERYTFKETPDDANIKAVDEDTATLQEQVLNVARTPEERLALEAEIKAGLKELEEKGVSGEKAVDAMIPCVVAKAKP